MPRSTDWSGTGGLKVQLLPELKIRPYAKGEISRGDANKGASRAAGQGGNYAGGSGHFPAQAGAPPMDEGVKAGQLYYKPGGGSGGPGGASSDDADDDDNSKGGLIKKVKGPKPIGSKDDGRIKAQKGEFMIKRAVVQKHGVNALNALNQGRAKIVMAKPSAAAKSVAPTRRK